MVKIGLRSCVGCRGEHYAAGLWSHEKCRVLLDAKARKVEVASNRAAEKATPDGPASNRKQRWVREKYNEYMREYMRRRRGNYGGGVADGVGGRS